MSGELFVDVKSFRDKTLLHINVPRHFNYKGQWLPTTKGITLDINEWTILKNKVDEIDRSFQHHKNKKNNQETQDHTDYTPSYTPRKTDDIDNDLPSLYGH